MTITPGTRLGPYEVQATLGAGGMGEVYKARDTRLDRTVAIKVLPEALAADPQFRERFDREARTISSLDHPHICALYDVGEQDGVSFLVMQYLEGETLAQRLRSVASGFRGTNIGLPINEALTIAIQIASALDAAHRIGITHRDLKPGNVMLTNTGQGSPHAKLLDFGLAKSTGPAQAGHHVPRAHVSLLPARPPAFSLSRPREDRRPHRCGRDLRRLARFERETQAAADRGTDDVGAYYAHRQLDNGPEEVKR